MKIISLLENTTQKCGMEVEHGLSLYIEANGKRILFDMGQSDLFAKNAERLGIDLSEVDVAVISHGHYDHGGGLGCFLSLNSKAPIYLSRHAFGARFNASGKYIGLCDSLCSCERIIYTDGDTQIDENMTLCYADEQRLVRPIEPFGTRRFTSIRPSFPHRCLPTIWAAHRCRKRWRKTHRWACSTRWSCRR